jgi:L-ascorbate metabolism protein UlaG (beta-lactamase superfamily)
VTRTNAPIIDVYLPSLDTAAMVQVMERAGDLDDYQQADGTLSMDDHLDVIADHVVEPDLARDDVETLAAPDAAALFEQIVQDATNKAAVPGQDQGTRS